MCGIAGIVDRAAGRADEAMGRMLSVMSHRGPDGEGVFAEDGVVLGHRRLAILDPTPAGAQPMTDATGRYVCTYNGEIYNYVELRRTLIRQGFSFRSGSDTEVLLAAFAHWGTGCLDRLNGMFAFAVYDRVTGRLFCARDRLGVKPFVYTVDSRRFAFASEHKALIAAGLATDRLAPEAVYEFIARGYVTGGHSFYRDLRTLRPGWALVVERDGSHRMWEWWNPTAVADAEEPAAFWPEQVRDILEDAARLRLRSDVPVAAHLSGGLDSSAVVAAAVRTGGSGLVTFTGAFPGTAGGDERPHARLVADALGLRRVELVLDIDDLAIVFDRVQWHLDEPTAGPGVLPQQLVYDATAAHGAKVVLAGHGGDESFGGYLRHRGVYFKEQFAGGDRLRDRAAAAAELSRLMLGEWRRIRRTAGRVPDEALEPDFVASIDPGFRVEARRGPLQVGSTRDLMLWDLRHYLPALLHAEDRISMAASVESRAPLLDYRLVELAARLPVSAHFERGAPKPLLRAAVRPWLPRPVAQRRDKRGFPTPLERWESRPRFRRLVDDLLRSAGTGTAGPGVFSPKYLARPEAMAPSELWTVLSVQGWLRGSYRTGAAKPAPSGVMR